MRLSTWMPYESARELLEDLLGVQVSKATARRATLHAGEAALAVWEAEVERLEAGSSPGACGSRGSRQASDEWGWSHGASGRRRVGGSQDAGDRGGHAQSRGRSARSTSRTARASVMPRALSKQRCSKRIGEGWNGPPRCARCKMAQSGCKDWSTTTVPMRCAFSTLRMPPNISTTSGRRCRQQEADYLLAGWRECCTGSSTRDQHGCSTPGLVGRALSQPTDAGEIDLLAEARSAHAVSNLSGGGLAHWLRQRVESANKLVVEARLKGAGMRWGRQNVNPDAGIAQCRVQSRVEADLGDSSGTSTSPAHTTSASTEPTAAGACLLVPRRLGRTGASAVSSLCCCSHDDGPGHREAPNALVLALGTPGANPFSDVLLPPWCYSRALCKKMKHTLGWISDQPMI